MGLTGVNARIYFLLFVGVRSIWHLTRFGRTDDGNIWSLRQNGGGFAEDLRRRVETRRTLVATATARARATAKATAGPPLREG